MHAVMHVAKPSTVSVEGGKLVRMILLPTTKGKKNSGVVHISLTAVGDHMARGAIIVDADKKPVQARRMPVRRYLGAKIEWDIYVFDPGDQYDCCFDADPRTPQQHRMIYKA